MRYLCALVLVLGSVLAAPAAEPSLAEARRSWLRGHYQEARAQYEELARDPKQRDAARLGLSKTWQSEGDYDQALEVVEAGVKESPRSADLQARRAELLYLRGRWDEADQAAGAALALQKDHFLAHWVRGEMDRDRGDVDKADDQFSQIVTTYSERSNHDNDVKDPDELLLIGRAGCEHAQWNHLADQFSFILNEVYGEALKNDKDFWPAEYQAGMLLLEKYNRGDALPALQKALTINPRAAEALTGLGVAALQKLDINDAARFADRALKINPHLPEALCLRADVSLTSGDVGKALQDLEQARQISPRDENILGRLAACLVLQNRRDDLGKLVREVAGFDSKPGLFYYQLGRQLEERHRFEEAAKDFRQAADLRPMLPWALNSLGLLEMRLGREPEARALLTRAFEADPFNVRVSNSLKVLHHLEKYETLKTAHFQLRYDPQHDRQLARYMARYLEEIYTDLSDKFQYQPREPYLVEVFTSHAMFSGRTIALPDLHTIGACTGRVVALVSPRGEGVGQPFNWARVLRHEVVHLFNLEQTNFLVPHWFTEGLAVINEGFPRPQSWNDILQAHAAAGDLFHLDNIELGFVRPRDGEEWNLAYCQARLYVEFLKEKYGRQTVGEMLKAYGDGLDTRSAIVRVCHVDQETFEKDYRAYVAGIVQSLGNKPTAKPRTLEELKEAQEKDPDNADLAAQLAEQHLLRSQPAEARALADRVLARLPRQPLASYVKARLLLAAGEEEAARKLLENAADPKTPDPRVVKQLGILYLKAGDFPHAAGMLELGRQAQPYETYWLTELAKVYVHTGDKDKQIQVLKELAPLDADDLDTRKRLAGLLEAAGRHAEAEQYARQALEIDVVDEEAQQALGDALLAQKKYDGAREAYATILEVNDKAEEARLKLARVYLETGDKTKAAAEVQKVLAHDPDNQEAQRLRKLLE
ncbi:MAG: tetratricopeptide repeat protein [Planctomycetes bacterium]|nr:tetratricopeptide repeat protein [Planctomycetota bacterium]